MSKFIKRFNKLYLSLPADMQPHQTATKVIFVAAFDSEFGFSLRERKPATLDDAQTDALEIEENFSSTPKGNMNRMLEEGEKRKYPPQAKT